MNEWERYAVARERLRDMRLADGLLEDLGWMAREQALPLMEEIIAGGRDAVQRLNAARGWVDRATVGVGHHGAPKTRPVR